MNLKVIIASLVASLVLGASSVALAAPSVTVSATVHGGHGTTVIREGHGTTVVRDRRSYQSPPIMRPTPASPPIVTHSPPIMRPGHWKPAYRPVTLASNLAFTQEGRRFITVGAQAGTFSKLEVNGAGGRTFIQQIYVQFDNGEEQVVRNLDRTLTGHERMTLDLDGNRRAIRRIVVYGTNLDNGVRHEANAFDVTAS